MKLVLQILKLQMNIGVQPEQMKMENMLEEVDIMDSVIKDVHSLDKNHNDNKENKKIKIKKCVFLQELHLKIFHLQNSTHKKSIFM